MVLAGLVLLLAARRADAKRVVCIDVAKDGGGNPTENGFLSNHEGYERARARAGDVIVRGGALTDCLAQVADGDELVIVAHGLTINGAQGAGFRWCGETYTGFGDGDGLMPLPAGFSELERVTASFCACWSANDPDGEGRDRPLTEKLLDAMGGDPSNTATGFTGIAEANACLEYPYPQGLTPEQEADYDRIVGACIAADGSWRDKPPVNRSSPAPNPNQETCLQAILNACTNFTDLMPPPVIRIVYNKAPTDAGRGGDTGGGGGGGTGCGLAGFVLEGHDLPDASVPLLSPLGLLALLGILAAGGALARRRRRR